MILSVYTDGGSRGNPGPASIGIVATLGNREVLTHSEAIGVATNNTAEYTAIIRAMTLLAPQIQEFGATEIRFNSDSKLLVEQLSGRFKVKTPHIQALFQQVKVLEMSFGIPIAYQWVERAKNSYADDLVNKAHPTPKR